MGTTLRQHFPSMTRLLAHSVEHVKTSCKPVAQAHGFRQHTLKAVQHPATCSSTPLTAVRRTPRNIQFTINARSLSDADDVGISAVNDSPFKEAPHETWEAIAQSARHALMHEVARGESRMDVVNAALHVASEDDAVKTRTHIPLPVESFSGRLDSAVSDCASQMRRAFTEQGQQQQQQQAGGDAEARLSFAQHFLYDVWGMKLATDMWEGLFSPYRVYMHNVLAQRCGTQAAAAAVLAALLLRLRAVGAIDFEAMVGLPADPTARPVAKVIRGSSGSRGGAQGGSEPADGVRWLSSYELLCELLDALKRFYWSWDWELGAASGFETCGTALLGRTGRAGQVNAAVGVMQPVGRPFGNVELSILATERLAAVWGEVAPGGWQQAVQQRDLGVLLCHVGRCEEGVRLLEEYVRWLQGEPARAQAPHLFAPLVSQLLEAERRLLQQAAAAAAGSTDSVGASISAVQDFLKPDLD